MYPNAWYPTSRKCNSTSSSLQIQLQLVLVGTNISNTEIYDFIGSETKGIL